MQHHGAGREAQDALEDSRSIIAQALNAQADEIAFTSGGTESVALAVGGVFRAARSKGYRIVTTAVEHPSVPGACSNLDGARVVWTSVDGYGRLDLDAFSDEVREPGTVLISVQHTNHEVGTVQPLAEAARLAREAGVLVHTDACQAAGRLPLDVQALDVDLLSISGHKFGGPGGIGALWVRPGVALAGSPKGDDRERRRRAGMENVIGAVAMGAALSASLERSGDRAAKHWALTDRLRQGIAAIGGIVHGHPTQRAPHIVSFSVPDLDPEVLLMALDERGFQLGGGGVSSGLPHEPSPVLRAMGFPGTPSLRLSVGVDTEDSDIEALLVALDGLIRQLRKVEDVSSRALDRLRSRAGEVQAD